MSNEPKFNRRQFLSAASVAGLGLGLAACGAGTPPPPAPRVVDSGMAAGTPAAGDSQTGLTPDEMDAAHEKVVKDFVANLDANNKIYWTPKLPFKTEGDTKVFELTCKEGDWETRPGEKLKAQTYNGIVPGPEIRVTEGDKVRVIVKNEMKESTTVHWHGVHTPNNMDGVGYVNQPPIKSGETFTYEFVAKNSGSHMYHSHHNAAEQVTKGLLGAFIIEPKDKSKEPKFDSDYTLILNDTNIGLTINGRSFPGTGAIVAKLGEKVRIRFMNEGMLIHPMHLHGFWMNVITKDGAPLASPYYADVLNVAPGERYDAIVDCNAPGVWAFHCHILTHAESARGMFGMVTALIVK